MTNVKAIAAGYRHSTALLNDGTVYCWGENSCGQLGIGGWDSSAHPLPEQIEGLTGIVSIAAGYNQSLAVDGTTGEVYAWGYNGEGQLGRGRYKWQGVDFWIRWLWAIRRRSK